MTYMITPEQSSSIMDKINKYIEEHPEIIEQAAEEFTKDFVNVKDIPFGEKKPFENLHPAEIPIKLHTYSYNNKVGH